MANAQRQYTYFIVNEPNVPESILVFDTQEISVGRSKENDLQAQCPEMSRRHAMLMRSGNQCTVQNLSTSSGTKVNEISVEAHTLQNQDVIQLSDLTLTFVEGTENPASLGKKIVYASQLKGFGPAAGQEGDAEATVLGVANSSPEDDEISATWEVQAPGAFEADLHGLEQPNAESEPRDLDNALELEGFGLDDLDLPEAGEREPVAPATSKPQPSVATTPPKAAPSPSARPPQPAPPLDPSSQADPTPPSTAAAKSEAWTLDDTGSGTPENPQRASLHLEIEGLTPELQAIVKSLEGKVISLPALQIRLKGDDLG